MTVTSVPCPSSLSDRAWPSTASLALGVGGKVEPARLVPTRARRDIGEQGTYLLTVMALWVACAVPKC